VKERLAIGEATSHHPPLAARPSMTTCLLAFGLRPWRGQCEADRGLGREERDVWNECMVSGGRGGVRRWTVCVLLSRGEMGDGRRQKLRG
jgi:hypothetical protein